MHDESAAAGARRRVELTAAARAELAALGLDGTVGAVHAGLDARAERSPLPKRAISAPQVLNEAPEYASSFSRGVRVELPGASMLFISGTASIDEQGRTVHVGDFAAQCLRTYRNLTGLLAAEGASWHDVAKTTCFLRDIERDYAAFNDVRTMFMAAAGLDPLPASVGIEARLCRGDLLVEIDALAIVPRPGGPA